MERRVARFAIVNVTVIVPAHNEGGAFGATLVSLADDLSAHGREGDVFSFLIVDDGSTDDTFAGAANFARYRSNVTVLRHRVNRGLGAALRTAFAHAGRQATVVLDADLSYDAATALDLIDRLRSSGADIVLASAYAPGGHVRNVPFVRRVLSREANRLLSLSTGGRLSTLTCMVRAHGAGVASRLRFCADGMEAVPEMLLDALKQGMRVTEAPATLAWTRQRRSAVRPLRARAAARRIAAIVAMAFAHRPALWLGVPGLVPGVLPLVIAVLLYLHVRPATFAIATTATIVVQYASLALLGGQLAAFFGRRITFRRCHGVTSGYNVTNRTA
jgi:dolichol-phosphate mannosyltransferase